MKIFGKEVSSLKYQSLFVLLSLAFVSSVMTGIYLSEGKNLLYGDAVSRLNISRKILDNLTPGLAQLGNVWLPLPQIFMLPTIWNSFAWHSGISGALMSMTAFILGGYFLYKSARILTNSFASSLFAVSMYALNVNLLYFQTTAMSEALFISALCVAIYYFLIWIKSGTRLYLVPAALAVSLMTLIRYEALAVLGASVIAVFVYSFYYSRKSKIAESNTILYATLACLGFILWTIYLTAIFGDPLYWKNYYAGANIVSGSNENIRTYAQGLSFFAAASRYATAVVWMNGLIPAIIALISLPIFVFMSIRRNSQYFLAVLMPLSIFAFMILTLMRNTPITQPELNIVNILSSKTSKENEFNIRYGLLMLPMIALLCAYLFSFRFILLKIVFIAAFCIQLYSYVNPAYSVIYQIPIAIEGSVGPGGIRSRRYVDWLKHNYDGGYIMISALKHDPQMFELGYDYKTYIHEGTGKYWKESQKFPHRYAKWIVMDYANKGDQVTKYLKDAPEIKAYFKKVYDRDGIHIYKIKGKTERTIE